MSCHLPVVWSQRGPVPEEPVVPLFLVQSKSSVVDCVQVQSPISKSQLYEVNVETAIRKQ